MWPYYKLAAGAALNELARTLTANFPVKVRWGRVFAVAGHSRRLSGRILLPGGLEAFVTLPADVVHDAMREGLPAPKVHPEAKIIKAAEGLAPPILVIKDGDRLRLRYLKRRGGAWPLVSPQNYLKFATQILELKKPET